MHIPITNGGEPVLRGEVLDPTDYIVEVYTKLGLEATFDSYLLGGSTDEDVNTRLSGYAVTLAEIAQSSAGVDVTMVRFGVDHLADSMNKVCNERFGYQSPKSVGEAALLKLGMIRPEPQQYVERLDEHYWQRQFPEELMGQGEVKREPNESEQDYAARVIQNSMQAHLFSRFKNVAPSLILARLWTGQRR